MEEPKNHNVYDFGIFGRVPSLKTNIILSFEKPGYLNKSKKIPNHFNQYYHSYRFHNLRNPFFDIFRKDGRRRKPTNRLITSWKSWIWDRYLSDNMRWKFGNMEQISFENVEGVFNLET